MDVCFMLVHLLPLVGIWGITSREVLCSCCQVLSVKWACSWFLQQFLQFHVVAEKLLSPVFFVCQWVGEIGGVYLWLCLCCGRWDCVRLLHTGCVMFPQRHFQGQRVPKPVFKCVWVCVCSRIVCVCVWERECEGVGESTFKFMFTSVICSFLLCIPSHVWWESFKRSVEQKRPRWHDLSDLACLWQWRAKIWHNRVSLKGMYACVCVCVCVCVSLCVCND